MAFANKIGGLLKKVTASSPSIYQSIRCMSSSKLFIGGLSYDTDDQSLREAFTSFGEVIDARVIVDRESGRSKGFGFVTFTSTDEASAAVTAMDGKDLHGRRVGVNYANDRARGFSGGGGGYGGGGGNYGGGSYGSGGGYGGGGNYGVGSYGSGGGYGGNSSGGDGNYSVAGGGSSYGSGDFAGSGGGGGFGSGGGYGNSAVGSGDHGNKEDDLLDDFKDDDDEPDDYANKRS